MKENNIKTIKLVNVEENEIPTKTYTFPDSEMETYRKKSEYLNQLNDPRWHAKRDEILKRDNYKCRNCGSTENLQVHHRQYHYSSKQKKFNKIWDYSNHYLITLCAKCHQLGHKHYKVPVFIY